MYGDGKQSEQILYPYCAMP